MSLEVLNSLDMMENGILSLLGGKGDVGVRTK